MIAYEADYDETTTAQGAVDEWNDSAGADSPITVELEELPNGGFRVIAIHENGEKSVREWNVDSSSNESGTVPPAEPEIPDPNPPVDETTPPVSGDVSGLRCSVNSEVPNWDGTESPKYSHYAYLELNIADDGFSDPAVVRAYNEIDGSLIFESEASVGQRFVIIDREYLFDTPERDVFCDIRVEVEMAGEVMSVVSPAAQRDGIPGVRKGNEEYVYLYRNVSLANGVLSVS